MRSFVLGAFAFVFGAFLTGCGFAVTQADRDLAHELMAQSGSNCIYIEGGGGGATLVVPLPVVPAGAYGQGALAAAHSEQGHALECSGSGAKVLP